MRRMIAAALLCAAPAAARQPPTMRQATPPASATAATPRGGPIGGGGMLRMADSDGDGVVTREEYLAAVDERFGRMDRNGDGTLSADEIPMRDGPRRGLAGFGAPAGDTPPPPPPNGSAADATGTPPAPSPPPPLGARGPITRARYREMAMRRFDRWDADHDGKIDRNEMAAASRRGPRSDVGHGGRMPLPPGE